ncbi:MAG: DUF4406 domain-containing protein [Candidatus Doudnabacteria bacterium]
MTHDIHPTAQMLQNARTYSDLCEIALEQLNKFADQQIVQVCGPMTTGGLGSFEKNMEFFNRAITVLEDQGYIVFNQTSYNNDMLRIYAQTNENGYPQDLLVDFYEPIFKSKLIKELHFLPKWETSVGSRWERATAQKLDFIKILDFDPQLLI